MMGQISPAGFQSPMCMFYVHVIVEIKYFWLWKKKKKICYFLSTIIRNDNIQDVMSTKEQRKISYYAYLKLNTTWRGLCHDVNARLHMQCIHYRILHNRNSNAIRFILCVTVTHRSMVCDFKKSSFEFQIITWMPLVHCYLKAAKHYLNHWSQSFMTSHGQYE